MSEGDSPRSGGAPVAGIILIFVGALFLLQTMGVVPWSIWKTMLPYWPVIIIIIGLNIILRRTNPWLASLLILAILGGCLFMALRQQNIAMWASNLREIDLLWNMPIGIASLTLAMT
ncbi:MAG: DUF5668 domain-containing protein [Chloroflexota bacterium]